MSFRRTPSGLSNLHAFSGVDAIVFVEGGSSQSVQDVRSGRFESESKDIAFWQKCFSELGPKLTLQFRAVGSKPTLVSIAQEVASGIVTGVYVAMDRDFDNLLDRMIQAPKVLYTFGYSWENDVWKREVLEEVFYTLCGVCRTTVTINSIAVAAFDSFERALRWPTYADFVSFMHGIPLLPRRSAQKVMRIGGGMVPSIDKSAVRQCIRDAKLKRTGAVTATVRVRTSPLVDCCGHLVSTFGYCLLVYLFKKFCKDKTYPRYLMDSVAIDKFFDDIRQGKFEAVRVYYQRQLVA